MLLLENSGITHNIMCDPGPARCRRRRRSPPSSCAKPDREDPASSRCPAGWARNADGTGNGHGKTGSAVPAILQCLDHCLSPRQALAAARATARSQRHQSVAAPFCCCCALRRAAPSSADRLLLLPLLSSRAGVSAVTDREHRRPCAASLTAATPSSSPTSSPSGSLRETSAVVQ